jgi:predicted DNA-binding mobile mystery protein A
MARRDLRIARRALDRRLDVVRRSEEAFARPAGGWIKAVREALGMSTAQFARRMGTHRSAAYVLEEHELDEGIRLSSLRRAADALGCRLVYALVPEESLESTVERRAREIARARLGSVLQTMALEDQAIEESEVAAQIQEIARTLIDSRDLWEQP